MKGRLRLAFFGIVLFQVLFLLGLVGYKEVTLRFGQTVVLETVPVDPRDLFRGDYVVLRYTISDLSGFANAWEFHDGDTVYVHLEQKGDISEPTEVAKRPRPGWDVFLKGRVARINPSDPPILHVEYGIESYFVPEGEGLEIQRARDLKVQVSVNRFRNPVIKGLIVDGKPFELR